MLREIKIYGRLAKFLKRRVFKAEVSSPAEAIRFLLANFPEFESELSKGHYKVLAGDYSLSLDEICDPSGMQVIKIIPVVTGAGSGALKILAGVALIALSFVGFGAGAFAGLGIAGAFGSTAVFSVGASLVLGGVAQLLSPVPVLTAGAEEKDPRKSYSFSGIQNTSRQGTPVPIVYGETLVGSIIISAGIDTAQVTA